MLERAAVLQPPLPLAPASRPPPPPARWSVPKVKQFLSRLWATAYRRLHSEEKALQEPFIKFEATDQRSRTVYKELGAWPALQLAGEHSGCPFMSPGEGRASRVPGKPPPPAKRMTRKPRKEQATPLKHSGYCEICRTDYAHLSQHQQSASHINFVKNCSNFLSLDSLISDSADMEAFLKMNKPVTNNSLERRSLRNTKGPPEQLEVICNGLEPHSPRSSPGLGHYLRSKGDSPSPRPLANGAPPSPPRLNGEGRKPRSIRWRRPSPAQTYYRVVGMSTKLRSSATFAPQPAPQRTPPGQAAGLVVKFRRVRRSELSVLSDEAENFMFPKKDSDTEDEAESTARPGSVLSGREERDTGASTGCLKWDQGRLQASAEVERLTYTFEQVPHTEPWYDTFRRQDQGKENTRNIIKYLGYYSKSLVLPYEMSELPPLKPNCCALGAAQRKPPEKLGLARSYGTRGMKNMKKVKQAEAAFPVNSNSLSRKSPREHASTLAILGGLVHSKRSKGSGSEDSKSLPSIAEEDCSSDTTPCAPAPASCDAQLFRQINALFSSVYDDDEEFDVPMEGIDCGLKLEHTRTKPDVIQLLQNYQDCDTLDNTVREIHHNTHPEAPKARRGYKFKKKNKTGWPSKKKLKKELQRAPPLDAEAEAEAECASWASWEEPEAEEQEPARGPAWELQPVVRVQKMEPRLERRLRSADALRRPHR